MDPSDRPETAEIDMWQIRCESPMVSAHGPQPTARGDACSKDIKVLVMEMLIGL